MKRDPWTHVPATLEEAVGVSMILFAGAYQGLFQPSESTSLVWRGALDGCSPASVIAAARRWITSGESRPPAPADIRRLARPHGADYGQAPVPARSAELERAIRARDEIAHLSARGVWARTDPAKREYLEAWAARAPAGVPADQFRSNDQVRQLVEGLARQFDARRAAPQKRLQP